ncbi:SACA9 protein, partial [Centropus unirufus]|nr:SACA9 protein [Centropus unirufus]
MNEVKEALRIVQQKYKLFLQQQFTFIRALEHARESAHDLIRPVASIGQVQSYMDHHCENSTDRRILDLFLNICNDLSQLCYRLESVHPGDCKTAGILEKCKLLLSPSNDLSTIRATYPHDVVNHLSCHEAKNHYGGVVSLIPVILDHLTEWLAHIEKLSRQVLYNVSGGSAVSGKRAPISQAPPSMCPEAGAAVSNKHNAQLQESEHIRKKNLNTTEYFYGIHKHPWKPPGRHA